MPWCPNCETEYVEGIQTCADCGAELVEELADKPLEAETAEDGDSSLLSKADATLKEEMDEELPLQHPMEKEAERGSGVYESSAEKADDFKSTGRMLAVLGGCGLLVLVLAALHLLPFHFTGSSGYLSYAVLGAMSFFFLVMGLSSVKSAGKYREKALNEGNLHDEILSWCQSTFSAKEIDQGLGEDLSEAEKYFWRTEKMKEILSRKFMNIDDRFLDHIMEELYSEIFGE